LLLSSRPSFTSNSSTKRTLSISSLTLDSGCKNSDHSRDIVTNSLCRLAELYMGVIAACVPTLRNFFGRASKRLSTSRPMKNKSNRISQYNFGSQQLSSNVTTTIKSSNSDKDGLYGHDHNHIYVSRDICSSWGENPMIAEDPSRVYNRF